MPGAITLSLKWPEAFLTSGSNIYAVTTRYARHSGRPVSCVADGINCAAAVSRGRGIAASAKTLE
eukprot:5617029-Pleurochrysis_carterae.AAC.1